MKRRLLFIAGMLGAFVLVVAASVWFAISTVSNLEPSTAFLDAPLVGPQMAGPTGLTPKSLVARMRGAGSDVNWQRSDDERLWVLHMATKDNDSGQPFTYFVRMAFIPDGSRAGVAHGPAVVVTELSGNGIYLSAPQIDAALNQIAERS
jgi:hypothetical protein